MTEAFTGQARLCRAIVEQALADPDPRHGFCAMIEKVCVLHARNQGFTAAIAAAYPDAVDPAADQQYSLRAAPGLARRAKPGVPG